MGGRSVDQGNEGRLRRVKISVCIETRKDAYGISTRRKGGETELKWGGTSFSRTTDIDGDDGCNDAVSDNAKTATMRCYTPSCKISHKVVCCHLLLMSIVCVFDHLMLLFVDVDNGG